MADLIGAIRLPEGSFRADAGTDVGVDILFFRKRRADEAPRNKISLDTVEVAPATEDRAAIKVNRYFSYHPEMVLGTHDLTSGRFGDGDTYVCRPKEGAVLEDELRFALTNLPEGIYDGEPEVIDAGFADKANVAFAAGAAAGSNIREGSYFIGKGSALMQIVDGQTQTVAIKSARSKDGIFAKHALIIRKLIPDPRRRSGNPALSRKQPAICASQVRLRIAWSSFVREFGPINFTSVSTTTDEETGEVRETHRRPNLAPFLDDPDCWLVASIEDYDLETNTAKPGPIFTERVISPPAPPIITSALDALAVVLNERGHVDPDHVAELLHSDTEPSSLNLALPSSAILPMGRGKLRMPISRAQSAPSSNSQKPPLHSIRCLPAMSRLCARFNRLISNPRTLPRGLARLGYRQLILSLSLSK